MINIWSWHHISFKGHMKMTFETDMMSCDPDIMVSWCMVHPLKVFGVWAINLSKDERLNTWLGTNSSCTPVACVDLCDPKSLLCIVATSTIGSCSLLCAAMGTVLHHHTALNRSHSALVLCMHKQAPRLSAQSSSLEPSPVLDSFHCIPKSFSET